MFITPSFKKSLIVEQFQGNYLKNVIIIRINIKKDHLIEISFTNERFNFMAYF